MKEVISTPAAPAPIGPFSQAIRIPGLVFVSGQVAADPATGALVGASAAEQTERTLRNVEAVLHAAGSALDRVVKTSVFLKDMKDFAAMNEVYGRFFAGAHPARTTVQIGRLPVDALVEIDVIALV
jgi:2-iminobutanoate/2-iminopropanoate deaminase